MVVPMVLNTGSITRIIHGELAEWIKNELLHFLSGLRTNVSRIADVYEAIGGRKVLSTTPERQQNTRRVG